MANALATYVHDHLAGAQFAISLLEDLRERAADESLGRLAGEILLEVEADRATLKDFADRLGSSENAMKETAAWLTQKASRMKLAPSQMFGAFEAVEMLCLGVCGKLALWKALTAIKPIDDRVAMLNLDELARRAIAQHSQLEQFRLSMARFALSERDDPSS